MSLLDKTIFILSCILILFLLYEMLLKPETFSDAPQINVKNLEESIFDFDNPNNVINTIIENDFSIDNINEFLYAKNDNGKNVLEEMSVLNFIYTLLKTNNSLYTFYKRLNLSILYQAGLSSDILLKIYEIISQNNSIDGDVIEFGDIDDVAKEKLSVLYLALLPYLNSHLDSFTQNMLNIHDDIPVVPNESDDFDVPNETDEFDVPLNQSDDFGDVPNETDVSNVTDETDEFGDVPNETDDFGDVPVNQTDAEEIDDIPLSTSKTQQLASTNIQELAAQAAEAAGNAAAKAILESQQI